MIAASFRVRTGADWQAGAIESEKRTGSRNRTPNDIHTSSPRQRGSRSSHRWVNGFDAATKTRTGRFHEGHERTHHPPAVPSGTPAADGTRSARLRKPPPVRERPGRPRGGCRRSGRTPARLAGTGDRVRRGRAARKPRHHALARRDLPGRRAQSRTGLRRQRQRRQPQLRPRRRQQRFEVHDRPRPRHRQLRCVRPGHRIHRLREPERDAGVHPPERRGEGTGGQGCRRARRVRHRRVRRRRHGHRSAARPARAQLGGEHLHPEWHQRHQPVRREQAEAAGLGATRGVAAGRAGVAVGGADRRPVGGGVLPARLEGDRDRSGRQLLLDDRLCGSRRGQGGDHPARSGPGRPGPHRGPGEQSLPHPRRHLRRPRFPLPHRGGPGLSHRPAPCGPRTGRLRPVGNCVPLSRRGAEQHRVRRLLHELPQPPPRGWSAHRDGGGRRRRVGDCRCNRRRRPNRGRGTRYRRGDGSRDPSLDRRRAVPARSTASNAGPSRKWPSNRLKSRPRRN